MPDICQKAGQNLGIGGRGVYRRQVACATQQVIPCAPDKASGFVHQIRWGGTILAARNDEAWQAKTRGWRDKVGPGDGRAGSRIA